MGRKPKPTALKLLEGNPGKRELNQFEPKPTDGLPICPEWLMEDAKEEWYRLAAVMNKMGILSEVDQSAFAVYCQTWARWKEAQEHIDNEGSTFETDSGQIKRNPWVAIANEWQAKLLSVCGEFGLTPSSRSRIVAANTKETEADGMEALLGA
jgi:P27 family predicted phage terminase small subunit